MRRLCLKLTLLLGLVLLAACGGGNAPTATPIDSKSLLDAAALAIQNATSLRFKLQLSGAPAFIDNANIISFVAADGRYLAPDRVAAKVSAAVAGVPGQIDLVAIGDQQYYKHIILTGDKWLNAAFSPGFNANTLIRAETGIKQALAALTQIEYVGVEDLFGVSVHHIRGVAPVSDISAVTVGLIRGTGMANADIFINTSSGRVERMVLVQPESVTTAYPDPTTWVMELYNYDDPAIGIENPIVP
jgi:hypothetical protein